MTEFSESTLESKKIYRICRSFIIRLFFFLRQGLLFETTLDFISPDFNSPDLNSPDLNSEEHFDCIFRKYL